MTTSTVLGITLAVSLTLSTILVVVLMRPLRTAAVTGHVQADGFEPEVNRG